jgi:hypothetical protein
MDVAKELAAAQPRSATRPGLALVLLDEVKVNGIDLPNTPIIPTV